MNLSEKSLSYYEECDVYKVFSECEDYPGLVEKYLKEEVQGKNILDLGCGNGKYLHLLNKSAKSLFGVDLSQNQLSLVNNKKDNVSIACADASSLPFKDKTFDVIYSCWMFGTILDIDKRNQAMSEAKRTMIPGGKIILIENNEGGEFEDVRGRNADSRTKDYNNWVLSQGFIKTKELPSYFLFESSYQANEVFKKIWKDNFNASLMAIVNHDIAVFEHTIAN